MINKEKIKKKQAIHMQTKRKPEKTLNLDNRSILIKY